MAKKKEQVLAARQKVNEFRKQEEKARKRARLFKQLAIVVGAIVVIGVIVAVVVLNGRTTEVAAPEPTAGEITVAGTSGVPFDLSDRNVRIGAEDAAVTVSIYEDFSCGHCQAYEAEIDSTVRELVAAGDMAVEYYPIRFVSNYGLRAGSVSTCVAEGAPEQWLDVHSALFANHSAQTDSWRYGQFRELVESVGVTDSGVLDCVESGTYSNWITENTEAAQQAGVQGTPTVMINGEPVNTPNAAQLRQIVAEFNAEG